LVLGIIGVLVSSRLLQTFLFGIGATDLRTMLTVALVLTGVAFIALSCAGASRHAGRPDQGIARRMIFLNLKTQSTTA